MNIVLQKPDLVFIEFRSLAAATFPNYLTVNSNKTPLEPGALTEFLRKDSSLCFFTHKARWNSASSRKSFNSYDSHESI